MRWGGRGREESKCWDLGRKEPAVPEARRVCVTAVQGAAERWENLFLLGFEAMPYVEISVNSYPAGIVVSF